MKQELRQIYADLSAGTITREEALARIKEVRHHEHTSGAGSLLFAPVWRDAAPSGALSATEHHVLLCGLPSVEAQLPHCRVTTLPPLHEDDLAQRYGEIALLLFERVQAILRGRPQGRVLLQVVIGDDEEQSLLAGLSGLLKTAALENPAFVGQVVLVPRDVEAGALAGWLSAEGSDAVVRHRRGVRQVLRWQEVEAPRDAAPIAFRDGGVYLITGGLGSLGTLFAREVLARTSDARVVLTGRGAVPSGPFATSDRVAYRQLDLADLAQVERVVASIRDEHGRLDGIVHCAGMTADEFILRKTAEEFRRVLEPKVTGTVYLDRATRDIELDFFVLFSSIAAALGNAGQSDYATANAFLDRFAAYRNALVANGRRHGRTRSMQWPLWQSGGMRLDAVLLDRWQRETGVQPMRTATGLTAFHRGLALPHDQLLVVEGSLDAMRRAFLEAEAPRAERVEAPPVVAIDAAALTAKTEEFLRGELASILKLPAEKIDPRAALERYGIDSILAMRLTGQLERTFGTLSKTLFFEYQTVGELAGYFAESHGARLAELFAAPRPSAEAVATAPKRAPFTPVRRAGRRREDVAPPAAAQAEPIAIIGVSGRYPQAPDLEAYWRNLRDGKDCITEVPRERWDWREYFSEDRSRAGSHFSKWGGFITGVDEFDPLFFNIAPKEAKQIDPQERLFLQHAWMALEHAGLTRAALQVPAEGDLPAQVGVYAGVMYNEYSLFAAESSANGKRVGIAGSVAGIANRVSYVLNLHGPSMTVDTMCSSSLTAIHLACQDLRLGRTHLAIAGGVNVTIHPNKYLALSAGQFISGDGHCQSFGEGGDGYIPGEGVGVVVLKRLSNAKRDGDPILAVIRGSALNHGGKTNGYTVPNPQAQAAAIARALAESNTDPRHISYIEAHGTGTKLGDPIEIAALAKAFQLSTRDTGFCLIGSAKSNIGHCESAAGIAGLTKVLLQLQHGEIVPSLHSERLNPHIDFARTPFIVNQTLRPWEQPVVEGRTLPRIAGISSFGAGGSNAHVVLEEYRVYREMPVQQADVVIVLSARTAGQLREKARDLAAFVRARRDTLDLLSLAWTLQAGREAMDERLAFAATSLDEVLQTLDAWLAGDASAVLQGRRGAEAKAGSLAEEWVSGAEVDWSALYDSIPQRITLPAYPFAKERYWIDVAPKQAAAAVLHPLLHANTSDMHEQRFTSTFTGREPFLVERDGRKVLPAVACLEMARAAVERALPERAGAIELRDVTWSDPLPADPDAPVSIALFAADDDALDFEIYRRDGNEEILHCEGRALALGRAVSGATAEWLIPAALETALGGAQFIASVRIDGACAGEPIVRTRGNDADVCDASGKVVIAVRGVQRMAESARSAIRLGAAAPGGAVRLFDRGNGIFAIELASSASLPRIAEAIARAHDEPSLRVVTIRGLEHLLAADAEPLRETLAAARCPIVALVTADPGAAGLAFAALCDFTVGEEARANELAASLATKPRKALELLKEHLSRPPAAPAHPIEEALDDAGTPAAEAGEVTPIALRSHVVSATLHPGGIAVVRMEDREGKNVFTPALMEGLEEAFAHVEADPACKVVVLTGYGHYFASGGTKESLLAIHAGTARFTDARIFRLPFDCTLPVIAAMQGHGIGAGWSLGLFADLAVLSEESRYVSPYMEYGFTPGAGATWSLPARLGSALARESLFTARPVTGLALRQRGLRLPVVPRAEVAATAMALAQRLARSPRARLVALKQQWTDAVRDPVEETLRRELAMHDATFVGQAETLARIQRSFDESTPPPAPQAARTSHTLDAVTATLRTLLAAELQLQESDIGEATQFIDLGLDSISGVSWIRKINEHYATSIEATKVYSHPTLAQLARLVHAEAQPVPAGNGPTPDSVTATLRTLLAAELQLQESDIGEATQFIDLGLDSISGVSWIRKINEHYATSIEATKVYSHPTLAQFARLVQTELGAREEAPPPAPQAQAEMAEVREVRTPRRRRTARVAVAAPRRPQPVAIIGMAGQFPQAGDLGQFWRNLAEGRDCIGEVPAGRWSLARFYREGAATPGKTNSRWVGALEHYDKFDPLFFNISPTEAEFMDPQQRLFLEASWHSIEHAGYDASTLSGTRCGVFVGCAAGDYQELSRRHRLSAQGFTGNATSILAARISYFLNLQGPCVSIDTACSSSLVAIAQACDSLNAGDSDLALAGGVYVMSGPEMHIRTAQAGMLSPHGRCFTFDRRADGFVPGEGVGVVVLKRLADAERDGDTIYGLIEGWGVNQDGRTNGITAPNPESQTRLMREVHEKFGIEPAGIQLVEAHGTGTKLGDPIEVEGLKAAFGPKAGEAHSCAIGSVKSNVGHCLTAAGIAGTLKLLLALQHEQLPPTIQFEQLNEHIDLGGSPFYVNTRLLPWPASALPRRAAISSFGFSGTNAHLVIGEFVAPQRALPEGNGPFLVPLSAKTPAQLHEKARDLAAFLREARDLHLADVAYTLQLGREAMDERVAFVVHSLSDLARQLEAWLAGGPAHRGHARRDKGTLAPVLGDQLDELAAAWAKGMPVDWSRFHDGPRPRRVALPLYPFAKERYWIDVVDDEAAPVLHPLLHANASDLHEMRFRSTFTGAEEFVREKAVGAGALLEMARAAAERALGHATIELRDVTFGRPLAIDGNTDVEIALAADGDDAVAFEIFTANEVVHCRGRALVATPGDVIAPAGTPMRIAAGEASLLLDAALRAVAVGRAAHTLDSLRVYGAFAEEMTAWVRGDASPIDVDLCDAGGAVRVALRGLALRAAEERGVVIAIPEWCASAKSSAADAQFAERHVLLCELPSVEAWSGCTTLQGDPHRSVAERYAEHALACFAALQPIARSGARALVQLVASDEQFLGLSALLQTAALEQTRLTTQLILVPAGITTDELRALLRDEQGLDPIVRITGHERKVRRWREVAAAPDTTPPFRDDGVYLITGGRGGLGTIFANEIVGRTGKARVILTGRAAAAPTPHERIAYRALDLTDAAGVRALVAEIIDEHGRLDGVLHCAGMTADNLLVNKSAAEFASVLAPKVTGTAHLDEATRDVALDFFVLFSSIASATGNAGQADYAAANGFLDGFAAWRNGEVAAGRRRGVTRAIHWPLWQAGGMALDRAMLELVRQTVGAEPMRTATGLQTFHRALALHCDELLVVEGDRARIHHYLRKSRLFEAEARGAAQESRIPMAELQQQLKGALAAVLGIDAAAIEPDRPFAELGLDSFLGAELIVAINKKYGSDLSQSRLFDYATIRELATFLEGELRQGSVPEPVAPAVAASVEPLPALERQLRSRRTRTHTVADERIAVIGMSGRYPQAADLKQFWSNLAAGRNSITEVPPSRWDVRRYYDADRTKKDRTYSKWLGAIDGHDRFDPLFFRISPQEADYMDPQHRLFLEESYHAFEDAGYSTAALSNEKCGVYLGITTSEYMTMIAKQGVMSAPVTSNSYAIAAARIAYYLNLKGPALSVDTACSSSLVALHLACQALRNGEIDMALAGGVTLWLTPGSYVAMSQAGMFSPDGQCKTFDDSANGIVNGEGVGAVVLKRLADAERDGDAIHGVILASGTNQDGRTNGITAPSVNSQIELERSVYAQHRIDPESITCVETHGTGTKLGDPIELEALSTVFSEKTTRRNFCALGSVKSNIGHTTAAAGMAGLQKVLLSMRHRTLVPTLNVTKETGRFDFTRSPFYLSRETKPWDVPAGMPRRAAISSFGFSGTNAHVVVEEYQAPAGAPAETGPVLVPLSARTSEQLLQKAADLLAHLGEVPLDLASVAWTLQSGREPMEERLAIVAGSVAELAEKLRAWIAGQPGGGVSRGRIDASDDAVNLIARDDDMREAVERWMARRKLEPLADLWVRGLDVDWSRLQGATRPRRVSLPLYPFAKDRCWIDDGAAREDDGGGSPILAEDAAAVERIIDQIANETIDPTEGANALRLLV